MTYAELCARLDANEHAHALHAVERIRYRTLESRLARAEATAHQERRLRYEHTLGENDELTRLRADVARLRSENDLLRRVALAQAPAEPPAPPPTGPQTPAPPGKGGQQAQTPRLSAAALAIMRRPPPDPAAFDRTIRDGEV